jgi:hypothetical protein
MTFWDFINNSKTRILGIATTVLGFVQAYPGLRDLLSDQAYAWTMFCIGLGVTVCGFLNARTPSGQISKQAGFVRGSMLIVLFALAMGLAGAACTHTREAYKAADTVDEQAYVAVEHYASLLREAVVLRGKPTTPGEAIVAMQEASAKVQPVAMRVRQLRDAYVAVKSAENEQQLQQAVNEVVLLIADLVRAVNKARGEPVGSTLHSPFPPNDVLLVEVQ